MFRHYRVILRELVINTLKHLNCKLYYKQLHFKYLCNLARYCLQLSEDDTIVSKHVGV
jgi:hypothetical protein